MLISLIFFFVNSWAQVGSTTDALGGASLANAHSLDSVWSNPAGIAASGGVFAGAHYFNGDVATETELTQAGITVTDASSGAFPGALAYRRRTYEVTGQKVKEEIYRLAAAFGVEDNLVMGFSGYRIHTEPWNAGKTNQDNFDIGLLWMPVGSLRVGAITRGVMGAKDNIYGPSRVVPSGGLGIRYMVGSGIVLFTDLNYGYEDIGTGKRLDERVGLEFVNSQNVAVRVGYNNDEWRRERRITAGIGWDGPKLRLGYSYQKETRADLGESHTVDIWLAF